MTSEGAEILFFPGVEVEHQLFGPEYAQTMAGHTVETVVRLGLDARFANFFEQHLNDLYLVVLEDKFECGEGKPYLDVQRIKTTNGHEETQWHRLLVVSQKDLVKREEQLKGIFESISGLKFHPEDLQALALDWVFYEQAAVALNNACYMQRTYDHYFPDFNGQSAYYRAERTISANFALQQDGTFSVEKDVDDFKTGFGIMMLHNSILTRHVISNHPGQETQLADWIVAALRREWPDAHRSGDIESRLRNIHPDGEVRRRLAEFVFSYLHDIDDTPQED